MAAEGCEPGCRSEREEAGAGKFSRNRFRLYDTRSKFYMVGRDKSALFWRVLIVDRLEPSKLNVHEEVVMYSGRYYEEALKRVDNGNALTGVLKSGTLCYGIVGFVKFSGPYYMILITERRRLGFICGHAIYAIAKSEMIALPPSTSGSNMSNTKIEKSCVGLNASSVIAYEPRQSFMLFCIIMKYMNETRYKRLFCTVDITKNFFFSYSYGVMRSLQKNLHDNLTGQVSYESLFVWNEFLTRGIRNHLKNTLWTVALVYGFFKQVTLSTLGKDFKLTLISRRSRHCAGTRFRKRGVDGKGRVANDVETEQIVFEELPGECPTEITSVVQHRGSIPLFWSQETSPLKFRPDITLVTDQTFQATRLHFENLVERYGNPIIILNLIKTQEKKPRESILGAEFAKAIDIINKELPEDDCLRFLHWDINKHSRRGTGVLTLLGKVAANALSLTSFFYSQVTTDLRLENAVRRPILEEGDAIEDLCKNYNSNVEEDTIVLENGVNEANNEPRYTCLAKSPKFQNGVLRTNCIDCLDRTNVAQYAFGLAALGHQLHALHLIGHQIIDLNDPLADDLMRVYEKMGDTLARQYCGSAAHNKIFSERRGQWEAATRSQEFLRTLQRYLNNAYLDCEKQNAINLFLGNSQLQPDTPSFLGFGLLKRTEGFNFQTSRSYAARSVLRRSMSDGSIIWESKEPATDADAGQTELVESVFPDSISQEKLSSTPQISICDTDASSSCTPTMIRDQFLVDGKHGSDVSCCSNFLNFDLLSSSGSSYEEDFFDRYSFIESSLESQSSENVMNGTHGESTPLSDNGCGIRGGNSIETTPHDNTVEFSDSFRNWVLHGETLYHNEFFLT